MEMRLFSDFVKIFRGLHIIFTKKFFFSLANVSDLSNKSALYCSGGKWGVFTTWWHLDGRQIIKLIIFIFPALSESEIWPGHDKHGSTALQLLLVISSIHTDAVCCLPKLHHLQENCRQCQNISQLNKAFGPFHIWYCTVVVERRSGSCRCWM